MLAVFDLKKWNKLSFQSQAYICAGRHKSCWSKLYFLSPYLSHKGDKHSQSGKHSNSVASKEKQKGWGQEKKEYTLMNMLYKNFTWSREN